jgi:guanylate kinase
VFIAPPTLEELQRRLKNRGADTEEQMIKRMKMAKADINRWDLAKQ